MLSPPLPLLYSFRRCPYAMRARLALQASGTLVELREVELKNKPEALLQASPKGTVPVLVLPEGPVLEQSLDIMLWALQTHDPLGWLPPDGSAHSDTLACIASNDGAFKQALDRYKYPARFALDNGLQHRAKGAQILKTWELRLRQNTFMAGAHWGLLDAALAPFVRQFAHTDPAWFAAQDWPLLARWLQLFEASPAFAAIMQKEPPWQQGEAPKRTNFALPAPA
jgi:glutathione S-transferase